MINVCVILLVVLLQCLLLCSGVKFLYNTQNYNSLSVTGTKCHQSDQNITLKNLAHFHDIQCLFGTHTQGHFETILLQCTGVILLELLLNPYQNYMVASSSKCVAFERNYRDCERFQRLGFKMKTYIIYCTCRYMYRFIYV